MRMIETESALIFERKAIKEIFLQRIITIYLVYFLLMISISSIILFKDFLFGFFLVAITLFMIIRFFRINLHAAQRTLTGIYLSTNQFILKFNSPQEVCTFEVLVEGIESVEFFNDTVMNFGGPKIKIALKEKIIVTFYLPYDIRIIQAKVIGNFIEQVNKRI